MTTLTEALELGLLNQCFLYLASNSPIYVGDRCPLITTSLDISSYSPKCLTGESLETSVCLVSSKHPPLICCQLDYEEHHQSLRTHIHPQTPTTDNIVTFCRSFLPYGPFQLLFSCHFIETQSHPD